MANCYNVFFRIEMNWGEKSLSPTDEFQLIQPEDQLLNSVEITKKTKNLLFPKNDYEYRRIRASIDHQRNTSGANLSAVIIQKTFRMYRIRKRFKFFFENFRRMKIETINPFFNLMLLQSFVPVPNRSKLYYSIINHRGIQAKLGSRFYAPSFKGFSITNQVLIPNSIDENKLIKFVKLIYAHSMRSIFASWRLQQIKARDERKFLDVFQLDEMSRRRYGILYVCFQMWLKYHRSKNPRNTITGANLPQWTNYLKVLNAARNRMQKADDKKNQTLIQNGLQALHYLIVRKKHESENINAAVEIHNINNMKFALKAWMKFLVENENKTASMRFVLHRWLGAVNRRKHLKMLSEAFKKRHQTYVKYHTFGVFEKAKRICEVCQTHSYIKIQQKPSLALFFIAILQKDDISEALCHSFHAWISLVRRRRHWHQFVFENITKTDYEATKRKALAALRNRSAPPLLTPIQWRSNRFRRETIEIYTNIANGEREETNMFLIIDDHKTAMEIQQKENKSNGIKQIRSVFFDVWKSMKPDISLFLRFVTVFTAKKIHEKNWEELPFEERSRRQYKRAIMFFIQNKIASEAKFSQVLKIIKDNNRRALTNRQLCLHRDRLILVAHDSHFDAKSLNMINPHFTTLDKVIIANQDVESAFKVLVPILQFTEINPVANESMFALVPGCTASFPSFSAQTKFLHKKIKDDQIRTELGHDIATRFDMLLAGKSGQSNAVNGIKTNSRSETFHRYMGGNVKSRPKTGFSNKLRSKFPGMERKPRIIQNMTTEKMVIDYDDDQNNGNEGRCEEEEDISELHSNESERINLNTSKNSMIFNQSMANSLLSIFSSSSKTSFVEVPGKEQQNMEDLFRSARESSRDGLNEPSDSLSTEKSGLKLPLAIQEAVESTAPVPSGYSEGVMHSVGILNDLDDPNASKKYKIFLEMLFGKQSNDVSNTFTNGLRRKLISEIKSRKPSLASAGVDTRSTSLPVTSAIEKYRKEMKKAREGDSRLVFVDDRLQKTKIVRTEAEIETAITFNCRRYRSLFSEEEDSSDEDDDDLKRQEEILNEAKGYEVNDANKKINEEEIDPAAQNKQQNNIIGQFPLATPYAMKDADDHTTITTVNKVVFHILEKAVKEEGEEGLLVEIDPEEMPEEIVDEPNKDPVSKARLRKKRFNFKPKPRNPHKAPIIKKKKETAPIVHNDKKEITNSMKEIIHEISPLAGLLFTKGQTTEIKAKRNKYDYARSAYKPNYRITKPNTQESSPPVDVAKVVTFTGGGRGIGSKSPLNFTAVRIANSKRRTTLRPLTAIVPPIIPIVEPNDKQKEQQKKKEKIKKENDNFKGILSELTHMIADYDQKHEFEKLRRRARNLRKKPAFVGFKKTQPSTVKLKDRVQSIYVGFSQKKELHETVNSLLEAFQDNPDYGPILVKTLDKVSNEVEKTNQNLKLLARKRVDARSTHSAVILDIPENLVSLRQKSNTTKVTAKNSPTKRSKKDLTNSSNDQSEQSISTIDEEFPEEEIYDDVNYSAVVISYRRGHASPGSLDAIVGPTSTTVRRFPTKKLDQKQQNELNSLHELEKDQEKNQEKELDNDYEKDNEKDYQKEKENSSSQQEEQLQKQQIKQLNLQVDATRRPKTMQTEANSYFDEINQYDLEEMMRILPYIITEKEIDYVIEASRAKTS